MVTRAGARKEREEEERIQQKQEESGVQPTAVEEIGESENSEEDELLEWTKELDEELFRGGREKPGVRKGRQKEE